MDFGILIQNRDKLLNELFTKNNMVPDIFGTNPINGIPNPVDINNTILLEGFGWEGYSLEISRNWENDWKNIRKRKFFDAQKWRSLYSEKQCLN